MSHSKNIVGLKYVKVLKAPRSTLKSKPSVSIFIKFGEKSAFDTNRIKSLDLNARVVMFVVNKFATSILQGNGICTLLIIITQKSVRDDK